MSYILEALRKADRERTLGKVPNLESIHIAPSLSPRRRWPWILALVALMNTTALAVFYFSSLQDRSPGPWQNPDARHSPTPPPTPTIHPSPESMITKDGFVDLKPATTEPILDGRLDAAHSSRSANPMGMAAEQESWPPPTLRALPMAFRSSLPPINVDVHVYSDDPDKRFVLINSRHYREGDQLVEGPLLETIDPQGTILQFQGQRFTIPVSR